MVLDHLHERLGGRLRTYSRLPRPLIAGIPAYRAPYALLQAVYVTFVGTQLASIMFPTFELDGPTLDPLWPQGAPLTAECFLSSRSNWEGERDFDGGALHIDTFAGLSFDWAGNERFTELNVSLSALQELDKAGVAGAEDMWSAVRTNGTLFLHVHVTMEGAASDPREPSYDKYRTVHQSHALMTFAPRRNAKNETFLVEKWLKKEAESLSMDEDDDGTPDPALTADVVSYWKPHMAIRLVTDFKRYPLQQVPGLVFQNLKYFQVQVSRKNRKPKNEWRYVPSMYLDDMGLTLEKLVPLNRSVSALPLRISYEPMSYARWQILLTMEMALQSQEQLGFSRQDIDTLRGMMADTNPYLLAVTMTVSLLHILFDWLAFKNDIAYWRAKNDDMVGISLRSMVVSFVSQSIILLYLIHEEATLLVTVPSGISCVLLVWKIAKVWRANKRKQAEAGGKNDRLTLTARVDAMATSHMMYVLAPLLVGYAGYSLLFKEHASWYGWALGSLTGAVYAFGFIMMTPQLVINYQLKSVAHLQWRFLIYRALNTFIDDLFAFVITMPTMHRLSCFRDDVVFFIYLYQRWIYPVDKSRKFDEDEGEAEHEKAE